MIKKRRLTSVDLFAGCGGLSLGLEQSGFETLLFSELNRDAAKTFLLNRLDSPPLEFSDVSSLTDTVIARLRREWRRERMTDVDLVCGGPPCQGYSGIGHRRSYKVEREEIPSNHLFHEMIRVINAIQPRMFLFENVRGLMSGRWTANGEKGEIWKDVLHAFQNIKGYQASPALVQARDYGVPQNRPRVLIVGIRDDLGWKIDKNLDAVENGLLPRPTGNAPDLVDVLDDLVDDDYLSKIETTEYQSDAISAFQREMRRSRNGRPFSRNRRVTEHLYSQHSDKIKQKFEYMLAHDGEIPPSMKTKKFAQRLLPPRWQDGPTITATSLPDDFVHYRQPRTLTVREWARLQCFPDWYEFAGPRTTGGTRRAGVPTEGIWQREAPKYTQIGNAVPVRLARAVGSHFAGILK